MAIVTPELRADSYCAAMIQSLTSACHHVDRSLTVLMARPQERHSLVDQVALSSVDGTLVFAPSLGDELAYEIVNADHRPVVFVGRTRVDFDQPTVDVENTEPCAELVGHLLNTAGPRIGMIAGTKGRLSSELRLDGYRRAHIRNNVPIDESLVMYGDYTRPSGYSAAKQLLKFEPDGIFAANDEMGLGAALAASELGLRIPTDLSLAGFDGSSAVRSDDLRLTSASQPFDALAHTAVKCLLDVIDGTPVQSLQLLAPDLHFGWSTQVPGE